MENYDVHPLMEWELVHSETGQRIPFDLNKLREAAKVLKTLGFSMIPDYEIRDLNKLGDNLTKMQNNFSNISGTIYNFAHELEKALESPAVNNGSVV